jgi:hypothetical protein
MAIDQIGTNGLVASAIVPPDGSITSAKIANDAVTSAKIGVDVIAAEDLANNSVTVAELANGAVTTAKIAANAVDHTKVGAGLVCGFTYLRRTAAQNTITTSRTLVLSESVGAVYTPKYNNSILKIQFAYPWHTDQSAAGANLYVEFWRSADGGSNWMNLLGDQSVTGTTAQIDTNIGQPSIRHRGYAAAGSYSNVECIDTTYNTTNELKFRMYGLELTGEDARLFEQELDPHPGGYFMVTEIAQ